MTHADIAPSRLRALEDPPTHVPLTPRPMAPPTASLDRLASYQAAREVAPKLYPPAVAALVVDQINWWVGFGLGCGTSTARLRDQVMAEAREKGLA